MRGKNNPFLPEGWECKKLIELGDVQTGTTPSTKYKEYYGDYIPFIKPPHFMLDGSIVYEGSGLSEKGLEKARLIKKNSILMVCIGATIGKTGITDRDVSCNQQINTFTPNDNLEPKYFYYLLSSLIFFKQVLELSSQATLPMINKTKWKNIEVMYPKSLPEQKQIVKTLDLAFGQIDQAKANLEQNLANAKELFASKLNEVFSQRGEGWEEKRLGDVCENLDSQRIPITKNKREEGNIPYYGASGIVDYVNDYIFDENLLLVSEDGANLLARTYPIAFSISGKNWVNNHAHVLKFKNMINQKFVEYYLNSIKLDDYVSGMAQPKLNQRMLNSILIPYPSINIQKKILEMIENLNTSIQTLQTHYQQNLNNLEELKKSILEKAFRGEL